MYWYYFWKAYDYVAFFVRYIRKQAPVHRCSNQISMHRSRIVAISIPRTALLRRIFSRKWDRRKHRIWKMLWSERMCNPYKRKKQISSYVRVERCAVNTRGVTDFKRNRFTSAKTIVDCNWTMCKIRLQTVKRCLAVRGYCSRMPQTLQIKFKSRAFAIPRGARKIHIAIVHDIR